MHPIRLVVADVDGTLVTRDKLLTERALAAVQRLRAASIAFAITSGRPARGLEMLTKRLTLETPVSAFNGGITVDSQLRMLQQRVLPQQTTEEVIGIISSYGLNVWIYQGEQWLILDRHGSHVDQEERTVQFSPLVVSDFRTYTYAVIKIVGVSDDLINVARCERALQERFAGEIGCGRSNPQREGRPTLSALRSQPYYLDVTHPDANKGSVVRDLAKRLSIPIKSIATFGDMPSDIPMFQASGLSVAMGQASDDVKRAATHVTASSEEEGFATGIEQFVLNLTERLASVAF